jgi:hypothetical protein
LAGAIFGLGCCAPAIPAKPTRIASITLDGFMATSKIGYFPVSTNVGLFPGPFTTSQPLPTTSPLITRNLRGNGTCGSKLFLAPGQEPVYAFAAFPPFCQRESLDQE